MPAPLDLALVAIALASLVFAFAGIDARGALVGDDELNDAILGAMI